MKNASPHLKLRKKPAIDLYFEYLLPKEKREILEDLKRGENIKIPNFKNVNVRNITNEFNEEDLVNIDEQESLIEKMIRFVTNTPLLKYDESRHQYSVAKIVDNVVKESNWIKRKIIGGNNG